MTQYATAPSLWPGSTIVCVGTGPSLTQADVDFCRGRARMIAINNAYTMAPWADVMYAADNKFWGWKHGAPEFTGLKYTIEPPCYDYPVHVLKNLGDVGLEGDASGLRTGFCSGYQAINLAFHFGATTIVLLGYDMHGTHYFGDHPNRTVPPFAACLAAFPTLVEPLRHAGVTVLNCTPGSVIDCFPRAVLQDVLQAEVAV